MIWSDLYNNLDRQIMKRILMAASAVMIMLCFCGMQVAAQERLPEYLQAEKFTQPKLSTMLFSTMVDPHWFGDG